MIRRDKRLACPLWQSASVAVNRKLYERRDKRLACQLLAVRQRRHCSVADNGKHWVNEVRPRGRARRLSLRILIPRDKGDMSTSSVTEPEIPGGKLSEIAPSDLAQPEFNLPRAVGLIGVALVFCGLMVLFVTSFSTTPRLIGRNGAFFLLALGIASLLFHALRDSESVVRKSYAVLGFFLIALAGLFAILDASTDSGGIVSAAESTQIKKFPLYGTGCIALGLCFLLAAGRHETEPEWRKALLGAIGGLGVVWALLGICGGILQDTFILPNGTLLAMLGLAYLAGFIAQTDPAGDNGFRAARAVGLAGILVMLYGIGRSVLPSLFHWQVEPFLVPNGLLLTAIGLIYLLASLAAISEWNLVVMTRREMQAYFYSPIAYVMAFVVGLMGGINYLNFLARLATGEIRMEPIVEGQFELIPYVMVFVIPVITMRLVAEEKRTGTYEVLMVSPVSEMSVVLSKFLAGWFFYLLMGVIWGVFLIGLRIGNGIPFDYRPLLSFYLAYGATGLTFIAIGLFFSSLTKNQMISAILTILAMLLMLIPPMLTSLKTSR